MSVFGTCDTYTSGWYEDKLVEMLCPEPTRDEGCRDNVLGSCSSKLIFSRTEVSLTPKIFKAADNIITFNWNRNELYFNGHQSIHWPSLRKLMETFKIRYINLSDTNLDDATVYMLFDGLGYQTPEVISLENNPLLTLTSIFKAFELCPARFHNDKKLWTIYTSIQVSESIAVNVG